MTLKTKLSSCVALLLVSAPAYAHVSLERPEAPRGKSYKAVLKIPHGCDGSPTHTVRVAIPEGYIGVKPMPKPGWTIKTERGAFSRASSVACGSAAPSGAKGFVTPRTPSGRVISRLSCPASTSPSLPAP